MTLTRFMGKTNYMKKQHFAILVQYAQDTHQDMNERIEKLDDLIKKAESEF